MSLYHSLCLQYIYLYICLWDPIYICLYPYLSPSLPAYRSMHRSIESSIDRSIGLPVCLFLDLSLYSLKSISTLHMSTFHSNLWSHRSWAPQLRTRSGVQIRGADCHTIGQHKWPPNGSDAAAGVPGLPRDLLMLALKNRVPNIEIQWNS